MNIKDIKTDDKRWDLVKTKPAEELPHNGIKFSPAMIAKSCMYRFGANAQETLDTIRLQCDMYYEAMVAERDATA